MELKASDLRIGNWIDTEDGITQATSIDCDIIWTNKGVSYHPKDIKGIPLTEEWLINFGFEKINERTFRIIDKSKDEKLGYKDERNWKELDIIYWEYIAMGSYAKGYKFKWNDEKYVNYQKEKTIDYVHKLQNIYFALTGEELTIKE